MNKREIGAAMEKATAAFLVNRGYTILKQNYRIKTGEIDIIARDEDAFVFIEVKYRKDYQMGTPFEAVDYRKQEKIRRTALYYMKENNVSPDAKLRFDVAGIIPDNAGGYLIKIIKNAF